MPLHPQSAAFLAAAAARKTRGWNEMPLSEARETFDSLELFGDGPALSHVQDLTTDTGIRLRIYQAEAEADSTTVMYFHGGGWVLGNVETHDAICRRIAHLSGCNVVSVDYRRAPEHRYPAALDDCFAATEFLRHRGREWGIPCERIIAAGDSAGGHLAFGVAQRTVRAGDPITGLVLIYPVVSPDFDRASYLEFGEGFGLTRDVMKWFWEQYLTSARLDGDVDLLLSRDVARLPQTHIITAEYDVLRSECEQLAELLHRSQVPVTTQQYDGMLHGFLHFSEAFDDGIRAAEDVAAVVRRMDQSSA